MKTFEKIATGWRKIYYPFTKRCGYLHESGYVIIFTSDYAWGVLSPNGEYLVQYTYPYDAFHYVEERLLNGEE